jgi:hypothetical protein
MGKTHLFMIHFGFVFSIICNHGGKMLIEILNMSMSEDLARASDKDWIRLESRQ